MNGELMALSAAACYGITHFVCGLLARRVPGLTVSLYAQLGGTAVSILAALALPFGTPTPADLGWGVLSGLGTGLAVAFLYRAMSSGAISVVVPVSDVGAVVIPVLVALLLLGERPPPGGIVGFCVALPALWLVSQSGGRERGNAAPGLRDALIAGVGFAITFLALKPIPLDAGLWPIVASRVASVAMILPLVATMGAPLKAPLRPGLAAAAVGIVGTAATVLYWMAVHHQLAAVATVLAALYPAVPVVLALVFLRERLNRKQVLGLCGAGAAIALIALP
ncbi:DMT family transporter [Actinomadura barringtoniae]|uniref:DMT family transporter n=1 Tax=Actinomadura barringtoniae TaxID=1427535 RepID=A0A939PQ56_9ACTN|nr:DMT family transporter [Actinomadura barringtoniae]MBO2452671.1 DMT family transporter [Actinomadura barringtoniae]